MAVDDVLVADASRRTSTLNAYVSGFGATRRIVVYDTLLDQAPAAEVEAVVAHELGHASDRDVRDGDGLGALGAVAVVVLLYLVGGWPPLDRWLGISGVGDGRSIAFLLAFVAVVSFVTTPVQSAVSRRVEARADVHALDLTEDPLTFAEMQRRLATVSKSDVTPNRVLYRWFGTHPTAAARHGDRPRLGADALGRHGADAPVARPRRRGGLRWRGCWSSPTTSRPGPAASRPSCTSWCAGSTRPTSSSTRRAGRGGRSSTPSSRSRWCARTPRCCCRPRRCGGGRRAWCGRAAATPCCSVRRRRWALLGPSLREAGASRLVALTHGHEAGWAQLPGPRQVLRRIGDGVDVVTYLGEYTRSRIASALSPAAAARMVRLTPGVDADAVPARRRRRRRCASGTGSATGRWWSACRG